MNPAFRAVPLLACLLSLFCLVAAPRASAGEAVKLALKFREGQILRYTYHETLAYTPPTKFVGVPGWVLEAKVDYTVKVKQVTEDQATVRLSFDRVTVIKDGNQIADLTVFPRGAEDVSATIKSNGETTFYKNIYITINKGGQLEYRVSTGGGVMATNTTAAIGSETFTLAADLDEGQGVIKIGVPPTRTVESPDHARLSEFKVDLTPRKLFELLMLPTVQLAEGQTFSIPIKYLGQEQLSYQGQADDAGFQGSVVKLELSPWTEPPGEASGIQPVVSGTMTYMIEPTGKLVRVRGKLRTEILVPGIGPQIGDTKIELTLRK